MFGNRIRDQSEKFGHMLVNGDYDMKGLAHDILGFEKIRRVRYQSDSELLSNRT